ncbi:MAG: two-component system response regulator [Labilithrix sp.]|nr:two-component system response regulator [Labilithrix sp.]
MFVPGMSEVSVCVVDDDESIRESVRGLLRSAGYAVEVFASAEEFLARDGLLGVGCVVLDVCMSGMSGPELQRKLVAEGVAPPIIFMSARSDDAMRTRTLTAGAIEFLQKPFDEDVLLRAIETALRAKGGGT